MPLKYNHGPAQAGQQHRTATACVMHKAAFYAPADEELLFSQLSDTEIIL